jgi:AcrR family transcriptional regulator/DNA-binding MarR family transcriptional regulator
VGVMSVSKPGRGAASRSHALRGPRVARTSVEGAPRTRVTEVQRARILSAAAVVVEELGYEGMSVARITSRAGVSRRTFYDQFDGREECFLALFDQAVARVGGIAQDATIAMGGRKGWRERIRSGLGAVLMLFDDEPAVGSLLVVEALGAGPRVLEARASVLDSLKAIIDEGRGEARRGDGPAPLTAEGVLGAVLSVIHARLLEQRAGMRSTDGRPSRGHVRRGALVGLLNPLMGMIVLPYLGRAAASKELACPVAKSSRAVEIPAWRKSSSVDPLDGLGMRLTYRTLQVLSAIAADPGASNRQVADTAGVHDQGQISKLLNRLERLGLIHNAGHGQPRGEPNAWTLTTRGSRVAEALRRPL